MESVGADIALCSKDSGWVITVVMEGAVKGINPT